MNSDRNDSLKFYQLSSDWKIHLIDAKTNQENLQVNRKFRRKTFREDRLSLVDKKIHRKRTSRCFWLRFDGSNHRIPDDFLFIRLETTPSFYLTPAGSRKIRENDRWSKKTKFSKISEFIFQRKIRTARKSLVLPRPKNLFLHRDFSCRKTHGRWINGLCGSRWRQWKSGFHSSFSWLPVTDRSLWKRIVFTITELEIVMSLWRFPSLILFSIIR